jgi:hypothetical protein
MDRDLVVRAQRGDLGAFEALATTTHREPDDASGGRVVVSGSGGCELGLRPLPALAADAHDAEVAEVDVEAAGPLEIPDQAGHVIGADLP